MNMTVIGRASAGDAGVRAVPTRMNAAVVTGPGRMSIEKVPVPEPASGEVRVRLSGCGVCASNLEPWAGPDWMEFPTPPGGLGHEGWGTVDALGAGVTGLSVGDRVTALFYNSYAQYDVGPAENVVRLPSGVADQPFPGEPLGCAMNVLRRSDIQPGQVVAIVGIGFLGAMLTRLASAAGAEVIGITRRPFALEVARNMGAAACVALDHADAVVERVKDLTDGRMCDRVIEVTGRQQPLDIAAELTRERGRLIIAGYHQDGPRQVNMQLWNWRGLDVVNAHERDPAIYLRGMREAIRPVEDGMLDPAAMITHRYPLERLGEALDATRDRPDGFLKAVVTM